MRRVGVARKRSISKMKTKLELALLCLILGSGAAVQAGPPTPLLISAEEAAQHHLPAIGFQMPANTGIATLNKFPSQGVYVQNQPTPPGGAYIFTIVGYSNLPTGQAGLQRFLKSRYPDAKFSEAPDWTASNGSKYPTCLFITGSSHARTAHAAVQISPKSGGENGAVMIHGYGPWTAEKPEYDHLTKAFANVQVHP